MDQQKEVLNAPMTVLGMVNGMIGGLILLLPVYTLHAGYFLSLIVIAISGFFSFYSCYLCVIHMGDQPDLDYTILRHFNGSRWPKIFYDFCIWISLIMIGLLYFELIMIQWEGLIPPHEFTFINPLVNGFVLFGLIFLLKYLELGASIMSYGIISIISYMIFLIWVIATSSQGDNDATPYPPFGSGAVDLAAAMAGAFQIQSFFIPVLKKNQKPQRYVFYTFMAYLIGGLAYCYIAFVGSVGIWHRTYQGDKHIQATVEGYFGSNTWEVNLIEGIYLIHLYSVFPEFIIISKKRFFSIFQAKESDHGHILPLEIVYFAVVVGVCFLAGFFRINVNDFIDINGGVIGFFFIYTIPSALHIKCLYFSKGKRPLPLVSIQGQPAVQQTKVVKEIQFSRHGSVTGGADSKQEVLQSLLKEKEREAGERESEAGSKEARLQPMVEHENDYFYCGCHISTYSRGRLILDWIAIVIMLGMGIFVMVNGIMTVVAS